MTECATLFSGRCHMHAFKDIHLKFIPRGNKLKAQQFSSQNEDKH